MSRGLVELITGGSGMVTEMRSRIEREPEPCEAYVYMKINGLVESKTRCQLERYTHEEHRTVIEGNVFEGRTYEVRWTGDEPYYD